MRGGINAAFDPHGVSQSFMRCPVSGLKRGSADGGSIPTTTCPFAKAFASPNGPSDLRGSIPTPAITPILHTPPPSPPLVASVKNNLVESLDYIGLSLSAGMQSLEYSKVLPTRTLPRSHNTTIRLDLPSPEYSPLSTPPLSPSSIYMDSPGELTPPATPSLLSSSLKSEEFSVTSATNPKKLDTLFISHMRFYMPGPHQNFLDYLSQFCIRPLVSEHPALQANYNSCLASLQKFRNSHIKVVTRYVICPARSANVLPRVVEVDGESKPVSSCS